MTAVQYTIKKGYLGMDIILKLPCMRKPKDMVIYPMSYDDKYIYLQGDGACLALERETGRAVYSNKGSAPMEYYLRYKPTHTYRLGTQIVQDIENALKGDSRYLEDGRTIEILMNI